MKKTIKEYIKNMEREIKYNKSSKDELKKDILIKIGFYQHERLIHLIVTSLVSIITLLLLITSLLINNILVIVLLMIFIFLLIPYMLHYYFLENSIQYLYKLYDELK